MTALSTPTPDTLDVSLFGVIPHLDVLARLLILQNTNGRHAVAHTKTRSERRGSTRKLYKQKGTGNARAGSSRSPVRKGGGVAFGPRSNANFVIKMNASERRLGLASALSLKSQEGNIRVLEKLDTKTGVMAKALHEVTSHGTALVLVSPAELQKAQSITNIHGVHVDVVTHANPAQILKNNFCVFTKDAMKTLTSHFIAS